MLIDRRVFAQFDWPLFILVLIVPCAGLFVQYSAGYDPELAIVPVSWLPITLQSASCAKQALYVGIGWLLMLFALALPISFLNKGAYLFYCLSLLSLAGLYKFGQSLHGAVRWYSFGAFNVQPSEIMKLAVILAMARYLAKHLPPPGGYGFWPLTVPFLIFLIPMALIAPQPDLGTALSVGAIGFTMIFFLGIRWRCLLWMFIVGLGAAVPGWYVLKPFQRARLEVLFAPEIDPKGVGYHIIQSKIAVGSGGAFGKGFLHGTQTQLEFLPEHTTDFVFSVLGEEWGFMGALVAVILLVSLIYRVLQVVARTKDPFPALVAVGVGAMLFFHSFVNMGMVIGILPVVGVPLPFFSYGGSAVVVLLVSLGLVLGISMRRFLFVSR